MLDFSKTESPRTLNRDYILSKITDSQIFYYYFGKFDLKNNFKSVFHKDNSPSTGFYISSSGKIIYNHLNGKEPKMDAFAFVQRLYNISFSDTLKRIAADFGLIDGSMRVLDNKQMKALANFDKSYKKETRIHFQPQKWNSENLAFWKQYHITKDELKKEGVYPINKLYINDKLIPNSSNSMRYALTIPHKNELLTKVYSPEGKDTLKWVSNIPLDMPFGMHNLNKSVDKCFAGKAVKDKIIIQKFLEAVIATQNESESSLPTKIVDDLIFTYDKVFLGWDNDETGLAEMNKMQPKGFTLAYVPEELNKQGIKDWSDLAKEYGLKAVERLLKECGVI